MGEAKRRGTLNERKDTAIAQGRRKKRFGGYVGGSRSVGASVVVAESAYVIIWLVVGVAGIGALLW